MLFVCFSRRLRDHLREHETGSSVVFHTFHGLCYTLAAKAGIELPKFADDETPPPSFFEQTLPDALVEAAAILGEQFDAVIVDEAQDLRTEWLDSLLVILRDPEKGAIWLFLDDNQDVFGSGLEIPDGYMRWDLSVNCRNTQAIHAEVMKKYRGEVEPQVKGPPGRDARFVPARDQPQAVAERDRAPVRRARRCRRRTSSCLSSHGTENSAVFNGLPGQYRLVDERGKRGKSDLLLLDPRLQGARVAGGDPVRARGHRRDVDGQSAVRRDLAGAESLCRRGAGQQSHRVPSIVEPHVHRPVSPVDRRPLCRGFT